MDASATSCIESVMIEFLDSLLPRQGRGDDETDLGRPQGQLAHGELRLPVAMGLHVASLPLHFRTQSR